MSNRETGGSLMFEELHRHIDALHERVQSLRGYL
jgi:hypothetical protein